ncbi:hypothetical protein E5163_10570 [Marinicauda algicola]|uniref:Tetratricopeptide repeat protein n=1 Tax=Marinicauda algicola TaxID=2029849 RepID=A0A4S2GZ93_9PROT|nr:hypothetical protein [Marinicauda algicola]TGY88261.1 hypothetical protein E5163_10570 [Marinicauda algicola]
MRPLAALALGLALPGLAQAQMGPHLDAAGYEDARGGFGAAAEIVWRVEREPLAGGQARTGERVMLAGEDWVLDGTGDTATLYDFAQARTVEIGEERFVNSATHAAARRNLDIYVQLSDAGEANLIEFGGARFHRFWLEAAMGVSAHEALLEITEDETGLTVRREGEVVARAGFGECYGATLDAAHEAALIAGLRRILPLHPGIGEALAARGQAPCALSFLIYSPESPQGRRETWTVTGAGFDAEPAIFPEGAQPGLPEAPFLNEIAGPAALALFQPEAPPAPGPLDFMAWIEAAREDGDLAGAMLLAVRETHHFGPCPTETVGSARLACTSAPELAREGIGDAGLERVVEALAALQAGNHGETVEQLLPFIGREDRAGAAARTIVANELVAWGPQGLAAHEGLAPVRLLAEALALDPYAPDAYWHLGRRHLAAGSPQAAFALFELGHALPGREATALLEQSLVIEEGIEQLAPGFFPRSQS